MRGRVEAKQQKTYIYVSSRSISFIHLRTLETLALTHTLTQYISTTTNMLLNSFFLALMTASASAHYMQVTTWSGRNCHGSSEIGCTSNPSL